MKSNHTLIMDSVVSALQKIKKDFPIPNTPAGSEKKFNMTVKKVTRKLDTLDNESERPAIVLADYLEQNRHLLADVVAQTVLLAVALLVKTDDKTKRPARDELDGLMDDVRAVFSVDPRWGGLARRTRIPQAELSTDIAEPEAEALMAVEIDHVEFVELELDDCQLNSMPTQIEDPSMSRYQSILNELFNVFLNIDGINFVERADIWPVPREQVFSKRCPALYYKERDKSFEYKGSTETMKFLPVSLAFYAVEKDETQFSPTIDKWVARIEEVIGNFGDLGLRATRTNIESIRTTGSEYPVVSIEAEIEILYVQSFKVA